MAQQGQGGALHIAIAEHKHGTSGYVAATKDDLYAQIAGFCREYWHEVERRAGPMTDYDGDQALVEGYYAGHDDETLFVEEATIPADPNPARDRTEAAPRPAPTVGDTKDLARAGWPPHPVHTRSDHQVWQKATGDPGLPGLGLARDRAQGLGDLDESAGGSGDECRRPRRDADPHVEEDGIMSPPGTLGSVVNVVTCAGQLQIVVLLANGARDLQRYGSWRDCSRSRTRTPKVPDSKNSTGSPRC